MFQLTRKNLMVKNLKRLRKQTERELGKKEAETFDFFPTTYELPVCDINDLHFTISFFQ